MLLDLVFFLPPLLDLEERVLDGASERLLAFEEEPFTEAVLSFASPSGIGKSDGVQVWPKRRETCRGAREIIALLSLNAAVNLPSARMHVTLRAASAWCGGLVPEQRVLTLGGKYVFDVYT